MSLEFDGSDQYVTVPDAADLSFGDGSNDSPLTFLGWMNVVDDATYDMLMTKEDVGGAKREWFWQVRSDDKLRLGIYDQSALKQAYRVSNAAIPMGSLIHVVSTYDGGGGATAANGMVFYINSALIASTAVNDANYVAMEPKTTDMLIGSEIDLVDFFKGGGFDFRIYSRALTPAEVQIIYNSRGSDNIVNGLVARWLMNEKPDGVVGAGASSVIDISGNSHHGTPSNSPVYRGAPLKLVRRLVSGIGT